MGQLRDETFTARSQINEILLRDLILLRILGVKVTRWNYETLSPGCGTSMELQMSAERRKRAAILTSEGDRESAVNSARGKAESSTPKLVRLLFSKRRLNKDDYPPSPSRTPAASPQGSSHS